MSSKISSAAYEASDMVERLKDKLYSKNRFFCTSDPVLDILSAMIPSNINIIPKESILYRARIMHCFYTASFRYIQILRKNNSGAFKGYNAKESMQPAPDNMGNGRVSPNFMPCLYTARNPETAIYEVKPNIRDVVSVAEIKTLEDINVVDLSVFPLMGRAAEQRGVNEWVLSIIVHEFLSVCRNPNKDYIFTQYISDFYKNQGFEAIEFSSSLYNLGRNVTVFKPEKCEAISSVTYKIDSIKLSFSQMK